MSCVSFALSIERPRRIACNTRRENSKLLVYARNLTQPRLSCTRSVGLDQLDLKTHRKYKRVFLVASKDDDGSIRTPIQQSELFQAFQGDLDCIFMHPIPTVYLRHIRTSDFAHGHADNTTSGFER